MAASNTFSYHVPGPIVPQTDVVTPNTFVALGVCLDGCDITWHIFVKPIRHDGGGGPEGGEVNDIFLNMQATIRMVLVPFGGTQLNALRAKAAAQAVGSDGTMVVPGTLFGENSKYIGLYIPVSATGEVDGPYWFKTCRVVLPGSVKPSTKETQPVLEFRAINYFPIASQNTISGVVLYARTAPP